MTVTAQALDTFVRHFRIAELPYDAPSSPKDGYFAAMAAENRLRENLLAGIVPTDVALVAPEMGCVAEVDALGRLCEPACAWRNPGHLGPESPFRTAGYLGGGIHVFAEIEVDSFDADPASEEWADAGSVMVTEGRVTTLNVPHWLRPLAPLLASTYGVGVAVHGEPIAFDFVEAEPMVIKDAISADEAALLRIYTAEGALAQARNAVDRRVSPEYRAAAKEQFRQEGRIDMSPPPRHLARDIVVPLLDRAAEHFGVPANQFTAPLMNYFPSAKKEWHIDRNPEREPGSWSRTVSLSVLLSEPGQDFTGGEIETPAGVVPLSLGDAVAFTSMTPHRVAPVQSGNRAALVVFGFWDGWNR